MILKSGTISDSFQIDIRGGNAKQGSNQRETAGRMDKKIVKL